MEKFGRVEQATDDNIIRRMRFAYWITKATDTLRIGNTYKVSTARVLTRMSLSVTLDVHFLPCLCVLRNRTLVLAPVPAVL